MSFASTIANVYFRYSDRNSLVYHVTIMIKGYVIITHSGVLIGLSFLPFLYGVYPVLAVV